MLGVYWETELHIVGDGKVVIIVFEIEVVQLFLIHNTGIEMLQVELIGKVIIETETIKNLFLNMDEWG